jgi:Ca2+-binding EF-hand superfamily protein
MKMIDKDNSGEVDVDEMVAYLLQSAAMTSDDKFEEKMKDFRVFITDALNEN